MPSIPPFAMQIGSQTTFKFGDVLEVSCKEEYIKDDKSFTRTVCQADGTFNEFLIVCNKGNIKFFYVYKHYYIVIF